jgi:hypothetical protein
MSRIRREIAGEVLLELSNDLYRLLANEKILTAVFVDPLPPKGNTYH